MDEYGMSIPLVRVNAFSVFSYTVDFSFADGQFLLACCMYLDHVGSCFVVVVAFGLHS